MPYKNSTQVNLYPSAYRGLNSDNNLVYDPESRLMTEENSGRPFTALADYKNGSFVIRYESGVIEFVIHGYYFKLSNFADMNSWAHIKLMKRGQDDATNTQYKALSLIPIDVNPNAITNQTSLDANGQFKGLELISNPDPLPEDTDTDFYLQLTDQYGEVPAASYLKFKAAAIDISWSDSSDTSYPLYNYISHNSSNLVIGDAVSHLISINGKIAVASAVDAASSGNDASIKTAGGICTGKSLRVGENLTVIGTTTLNGVTTLNAGLTSNADIDVVNHDIRIVDLNSDEVASISDSGDIWADGDLEINGSALFNNSIVCTANTTVSGILTVVGDVNLGDADSATPSDITLQGNISMEGPTEFLDTVTFTDSNLQLLGDSDLRVDGRVSIQDDAIPTYQNGSAALSLSDGGLFVTGASRFGGALLLNEEPELIQFGAYPGGAIATIGCSENSSTHAAESLELNWDSTFAQRISASGISFHHIDTTGQTPVYTTLGTIAASRVILDVPLRINGESLEVGDGITTTHLTLSSTSEPSLTSTSGALGIAGGLYAAGNIRTAKNIILKDPASTSGGFIGFGNGASGEVRPFVYIAEGALEKKMSGVDDYYEFKAENDSLAISARADISSDSKVYIAPDAEICRDLTVKGDATIVGDVQVSGQSTFASKVVSQSSMVIGVDTSAAIKSTGLIKFTTDPSSPDSSDMYIGWGSYSSSSPYYSITEGLMLHTASDTNTYIVTDLLDIRAGHGVQCDHAISAPSFIATSDIRLKENIKSFTPSKSILDLDIVEFDFKDEGSHHIGCIAQDLQEICPELVFEDKKGYLSIEESKIVYLLIDEVKKLKADLDALKQKLN